jgi:hypothetical protein
MIPSTNTKLLVAEDWKKLYQSFRNADFKSYDFETLRRTMINYLRANYPEDFNDYIDSSEYIALIDLIAYLGQNLSFRVDLNARENFLETAERRDSILRLAKLINYNPKRNVAAKGFLKISAVNTTDNVLDTNGTNLAETTITWNDSTNSEWYQQFVSILNSAMPGNFTFGRPNDRAVIDGINTEQYTINSNNLDVPVFSYNKAIDGTNMPFEIVSSTFSGKSYVYEDTPHPASQFNILFKNDSRGSGSQNTGFFVSFRQGTLKASSFEITTPTENEIVAVNVNDINDDDVWLWQLDANGKYSTAWEKVPSLTGNNVIYNSLGSSSRNIYAVISRESDQVDLNFADGNFGNLPKGSFRLFYRQSNGLSYVIKPDQMRGIQISVPYQNKIGQTHVLTLTLSLQYTVSNSSGAESSADIKLKAPQTYYTQNRMITAEDYNISPLSAGTDILKVKSINRTSSGISKYYELSDVSGKYSSTNIFGTDGILYKTNTQENIEFTFTSRNEIYGVLKGDLATVVASNGLRNFYYQEWPRPDATVLGTEWNLVTKSTNQTTGYFQDTISKKAQQTGYFSGNSLQYVTAGSLVKFIAPDKKDLADPTKTYPRSFYNGKIVLDSANIPGATKYIWSKVVNVIGDGANGGNGKLIDGTGPVILSNAIPTGAVPTKIIPKLVNVWSYSLETAIVNLCVSYRNFGLSFDRETRQWFIISETDVDLYSPFSLLYQADTSSQNLDSSWLIAFEWTGKSYKVYHRKTEYLFESEQETSFFFDKSQKNYDFVNSRVIKDQINVLGINSSNTSNSALGVDLSWEIDDLVVEPDGYQDPRKVKVSFYDAQNDGQLDDPDSFTAIVAPDAISADTGYKDHFVYFKLSDDGLKYMPVDPAEDTVVAYPNEDVVTEFDSTLVYYFYNSDVNVIKKWSSVTNTFELATNYLAFVGRSGLKFHYQHNSGDDRRLDPSKTNLIDIFMLTKTYDTTYRNWLISSSGTEPTPPTSSSLEENYSPALEQIKAISDTIIFQPIKYKPLFGSKAPLSLQATFKAVRNSSYNVSDNDLKSRIFTAIQNFFAIENWDFGQPFYFSELSTYVMNSLTPDITNFVIVPKSNSSFGSLLEVSCQSNELFVNAATVDNIEIIDAITSSALGLSTPIVTTASGV